ncbi:hypothetical protein J4H86_22300 [Spiractinospora alimapuensis]|uniref:hypothetical protein n=1 Tax=Spiractinospora alimapuensis TaxID=2820884 RepID=UPI001F2F3EBD|nr:hypothetical protein [Spiractinospora alimapuensis]QVQ51497.1 hypothetical protein J4H86_22300 [Spiractinospora alimapuensis]
MSGGDNMPIYSPPGGPSSGGSSSATVIVLVAVLGLLGLVALGGGAWLVLSSTGSASEPDTAPAPGDRDTEPEREPLVEPPFDAQTVEIRNVTLRFREEWDVFQIDPEDSGAEGAFLVVVPDPDDSCSEDTDWLDPDADDVCPHVKILPEAVHDDPREPVAPPGHTEDSPCAPEVPVEPAVGPAPPGVPTGEGLDIANGRVEQYEHALSCAEDASTMRWSQYLYDFEDEGVIAIDDWGSQAFFDALLYAGATPD